MAMTREEMQRLASYGRNGDTMLAHINPQEAALLKSMGGAGTINPKTGLPEYYGTWQMNYLKQNPFPEPEPLPTLGQALAPETVADVPAKLETVTVPAQGYRGQPATTPATQQVSPEYSQYADRAPALGAGGGRQVEGYTVPTDKTFADIPLVAQYDAQGNFKQLTLERGQYLTPDPSQPNIVSVPRINAQGQVIDFGVSDLSQQDNGSFGSMVREISTELGPILSSVLAYYMPGITGALAPSLSSVGITDKLAQSIVSSALANTVVQVAQGRPLEDALQSAVTTAVVTSGSPAIAKDINKVISNPAVTNAIVSAGSSAAMTALNGGSESDITKNLIGGLVGSGTASATDNRVIGSLVGGAITGGVAGAITGGISTYAAEEEARNRATRQTSGTSADPGIQVAGGDDATALKMASISAMPEMLGKSGETASPLSSFVEEGQTFYERTITGKSPDGKEYSYTVTYDPSGSSGRKVSYSTSGVVKDAEGNVIPSGGGGATASFTRPNFTATEAGVYTPTIITTGQPFTSSTRPTTNITPSDTSILNLISTGGGARDTTVGTGTQEGTSAGTSTRTDRGTDLGTGVIETGTGTRGTGTGTGGGAGTNVGTGAGVGTGTRVHTPAECNASRNDTIIRKQLQKLTARRREPPNKPSWATLVRI
jgi:hypothetical protein